MKTVIEKACPGGVANGVQAYAILNRAATALNINVPFECQGIVKIQW